MNEHELHKCYFDWLANKVFMYSNEIANYSKLLHTLHEIEYTYILEMDANRYNDGLELKKTFCLEVGIDRSYSDALGNQCSVFEMMVALSIRCEISIMTNPLHGDRTWLWFMSMLKSMNLYSQTNNAFSKEYSEQRINIMLNRLYNANGDGALFKVNYPTYDMRKVEVWTQMNWYLFENY